MVDFRARKPLLGGREAASMERLADLSTCPEGTCSEHDADNLPAPKGLYLYPAAEPMAISEPEHGPRFPSFLVANPSCPRRKAPALFALFEGFSKIRTSKLVLSPAKYVRRTPGVNLATSGCHRRLEPPQIISVSRNPCGVMSPE